MIQGELNTATSRFEVNGKVRLILCDGASATLECGLYGGVDEDDGTLSGELEIYGQAKGTGTLKVAATAEVLLPEYYADEEISVALAMKKLTVNGGELEATGAVPVVEANKTGESYGIRPGTAFL